MDPLEHHLLDASAQQREYFWHRVRWCAVRSMLPAARPFTLVDVGAGAGVLGEYLALERPLGRYGFVEPLGSLERRLEATYGADANRRGDDRFEDADFVCLLDVLEHQPDDRTFLDDLVAKLRPSAVLIVTVPALPSLWSAWDELLGHHRRYTKRTLLACAQPLQLAPLETSYLFPEMWPVAAIRRLRMGRRAEQGATAEQADFPELPAVVNSGLYALGRASLWARRAMPFGTSLLLTARRISR